MKEDESKTRSLRFREYKYNLDKPNSGEIKKTVFEGSYVFEVMKPPTKKFRPIIRSYEPETDETRAAYEEFLSLIKTQKPLDTSPLRTVRFVARIFRVILQNDAVDNLHKKKKIDLLLDPPVPDHVFHRLLSIAKLLTHDDDNDDDDAAGKEPIPLQQGGVNTTTV